MWYKYLILVILGLGSGVIISAGVFAFITIIGIIPRLVQYTKTQKYIKLYEDIIIIGGTLASTTMYIDYYIPIGNTLSVIYSAFAGIFVGCLSVSIAEVINVIPIMTRRGKLQKHVGAFIVVLGLGKALGSLMYYLIEGFYK